MSHASMAGYFLFFYNRYRKEEILKRKEEKLMSLLEVKNVKKIYTTRFGSNQVEALRDVNFTVERGEYVAIMGESGSGKTTLLNILAALDKPTEGKVYLKDRDLGKLKEKEIATFRRQNLGFVFQDFNLLDTFSLKDNIFLPLVLSGKKYPEMEKRLKPIAEKLGIEKHPFRTTRRFHTMCHHNNRLTFLVNRCKKIHQTVCRFRIQCSRRFIGKNQLWFRDQRSCNCSSLFLPTGHLIWIFLQ